MNDYTERQLENISRVEYIGIGGREFVKYGRFMFSIQDEGRTLKIFEKEDKTKNDNSD